MTTVPAGPTNGDVRSAINTKFDSLDATLASVRPRVMNGLISPLAAGATGSGTTDDTAILQSVIDNAGSGAIIDLSGVTGWKLSDPLYINKSLTLIFSASAPLEQTVWGKPHIIIDSANDVALLGTIRLVQNQTRSAITGMVSSTDSRIQAVFSDIANGGSSNYRTAASGVYIRRTCHRLKVQKLSVYGQYAGIGHYTVGNESVPYSEDNSIEELTVDTCDLGYLSGGFHRFTIGTVRAKNLTVTQYDGGGAVYVGLRAAQNTGLTIGSIIHEQNNVAAVANADSDPVSPTGNPSVTTFAIKSTYGFRIGEIIATDAQRLGGVDGATGEIGSIRARLSAFKGGSTNQAVQMRVQGDNIQGSLSYYQAADLKIGTLNVETAVDGSGTQGAQFMNTLNDARLHIESGYLRLTHATPGRAFRHTGGHLTLGRNFTIEYDNAAPTMSESNAAIAVISATGRILLDHPRFLGNHSKLLDVTGVLSARGSGATATASISGGAVTSATVTARGINYVLPPTVSFSGGGGSGAAGYATLQWNSLGYYEVAAITITSGGTGYTTAPTVSLTATTGSWEMRLDPNQIKCTHLDTTVLDQTGNNHIQFTALQETPTTLTAWSGTTSLLFRSRNYVKTANTSSAAIGSIGGMTNGQRYRIECGDSNTSLTHTAGSLVLLTGATRTAGSWKFSELVRINGVTYEVSAG